MDFLNFETVLIIVLIPHVTLAAGIIRDDVYHTQCPNHAASVYMVRQEDVEVKSRIQCVALCQQDQR